MTTVMAFGTFDILHPGHVDYLRQAKDLGTTLIVVIARDERVRRVKAKPPLHNEQERLKEVQAISHVDKAILGNSTDILKVLIDNKPDIVCLGYDQKPSAEELKREFRKRGITSRIAVLRHYKPHKYKSSIIRNNLKGNHEQEGYTE
jgi:FAD synthetase